MKSRFASTISLLMLLVIVASTVASASNNRDFRAELAGDREVPARMTDGEGDARLKLEKDGNTVRFKLKIEEITNVQMAHLHLGPVGANGPIVVWLYPRAAPAPTQSIPGEFDGTLAEGNISATDLVGPLAGQPLSALIDAINAGNIYVNVHTNDFIAPPNTGPGDFPGGEIRGQLHVHRDSD